MKNHLIVLSTFISSIGFSQVGVNTNEPKATLEVVASPSDNTKVDGIIAPRLAGDELKAKDALYGADQVGAIVYVTSAVTVPIDKTSNVTEVGYFFFDGDKWIKMEGGTVGGKSPWNVQETTNTATENNQNIYQTGSVAIGIDRAHSSAILDLNVEKFVNGEKKGFLIPRVSLNSVTDVVTIPTPEKGLMVYNKATALGLNYEGFAYWNGTQWRSIENIPLIKEQVLDLQCTEATLTPSILKAGVPYVGYLKVPYAGGNGAKYLGGISVSSTGNTGLTATLQPGTLSYGDGSIVYKVTGTPQVNGAAMEAKFQIMFGGYACQVSVGDSPLFEGVRLGKIVYVDENESGLPNPSKTVELGDLIFRLNWENELANRGPQIALAKRQSTNKSYKTLVTSSYPDGHTTGDKSKVDFMANEINVFKPIGETNDFNVPGVRIGYIADMESNTVYKFTISIIELRNRNSSGTGPWNMYALLVEQY